MSSSSKIRKTFSLSLILVLTILNLSILSLSALADEETSTGDREIVINAGEDIKSRAEEELSQRTSQKDDCQKQTSRWYVYNQVESFNQEENPFSPHPLYLPQQADADIKFKADLSSIPDNSLSETDKGTLRNTTIKQIPGCCYEYADDIIYDNNYNCEIDSGFETCNQLKDIALSLRNDQCQTVLTQDGATISEIQAVCNISFSCDENNNLIPSSSTDFTPHSSEYFNIDDKDKGLSAEGQGSSFYSNTEEGPIFTAINQVTSIMVGLVSTIAFVILIVGAYLLITSNGDENKIEKGKNSIKFALLGIMFVLLSFTIVRLVQSILF